MKGELIIGGRHSAEPASAGERLCQELYPREHHAARSVNGIAFVDTLAICAFIVLAVTLNPLPFELGVTELSGVATLLAFHVPSATGAVVMLSLRALATGFVIIVSLVVVFLLRGELVRAERLTEDVNSVQMGKIPSW